ncbi:hypothetical protein SCD75_09640 [Prescottella equi]|nr:hypothetical protein SCD75_09640 [Prescottella equi]
MKTTSTARHLKLIKGLPPKPRPIGRPLRLVTNAFGTEDVQQLREIAGTPALFAPRLVAFSGGVA